MGALPKRRISTARSGRRRLDKGVNVVGSRLTRSTKRQRKEMKKNDNQ